MEAMRIDLTPYPTGNLSPDGEPVMMQVGQSIINLLFNPSLGLTAIQALERDDIANDIRKADGSVTISKEAYGKIKSALDGFKGFTQEHIELIRRVQYAKSVTLTE